MMKRLRDRIPGMEHVILAWGSAREADCLSMEEMIDGADTTIIAHDVDLNHRRGDQLLRHPCRARRNAAP